MDGVLVEYAPGVVVGVLLPDYDAVVVGAGGKEAEAGVGPRHLPDWALVPDKDVVGAVRHLPVGAHLEDTHGLVPRRCGKPTPVVVKFDVVLNVSHVQTKWINYSVYTYTHTHTHTHTFFLQCFHRVH